MRAALLVGLVLLAVAPAASASQLIDRNAKDIRLGLAPDGSAFVTYTANGRRRTAQASGAVDARQPDPSKPQVAFKLNYAAKPPAKNVCGGYDGPPLAWLVSACKAKDGSYWALQAWQRALPNYGLPPNAAQSAWELRLSHWTGSIANLEVWTDWSWGGRVHSLFGRLLYEGQPVFGFRATGAGVPLDTYGRNLYLDTFNSAHGPGWKRENSFLARKGSGGFCYGFFPHGSRPSGRGERYRITVIGPGVTPDVMWEGAAQPDFDPNNPEHVTHEKEANAILTQIGGGKPLCHT